jgi:putative transposase
MTATLDDLPKKKPRPDPTAEQRAAEELVRRAREQGRSLTGPDGLLKQLTKTVLTESTGEAGIGVPRDRAGTFEPQIARKRQRRLSGVDEIVLSLYAKGLTTGEIGAHFAEIYGASVRGGSCR